MSSRLSSNGSPVSNRLSSNGDESPALLTQRTVFPVVEGVPSWSSEINLYDNNAQYEINSIQDASSSINNTPNSISVTQDVPSLPENIQGNTEDEREDERECRPFIRTEFKWWRPSSFAAVSPRHTLESNFTKT